MEMKTNRKLPKIIYVREHCSAMRIMEIDLFDSKHSQFVFNSHGLRHHVPAIIYHAHLNVCALCKLFHFASVMTTTNPM